MQEMIETREALLRAIEEGDLQKVENILKGIDPNEVWEGECGPLLFYAIRTEKRTAAMAELLIQNGAKATYADSEGYTLLHWLVGIDGTSSPVEDVKIARTLIKSGAAKEASNHYGWTPLMRAVLEGRLSEVDAFLRVGANPNKKYTQNSMPIFTRGLSQLMVAGSQTEKVELLLQYGADAQVKNDEGQTAAVYLKKILNNADMAPSVDSGFQKKYVEGLKQSIALIETANR